MDSLVKLGRELGSAHFAQGPGGNVSVKANGRLHVKASGRRLRELDLAGAISDVSLGDVKKALAGDKEADAAVFSSTPRPSLEAYFHALGSTVVAHTHALGAVLAGCAATLPKLPEGTLVVDYVSPGRGLAILVERALTDRKTATVLLKSHGVIVYADSTDDAVRETRAFDAACAAHFPPLADVSKQVEMLPAYSKAGTGFFIELSPRETSGKFLMPDAVVFASTFRVDDLKNPAEQAESALQSWGRPVILHSKKDGRRILAGRTESELQQASEVALAHDAVEDVLSKAGGGRYLPDDEPAKILNLPSEKYRLQLTGEKG